MYHLTPTAKTRREIWSLIWRTSRSWEEPHYKLLSEEQTAPAFDVDEFEIGHPSLKEVGASIRRFKNNKSPEADKIPKHIKGDITACINYRGVTYVVENCPKDILQYSSKEYIPIRSIQTIIGNYQSGWMIRLEFHSLVYDGKMSSVQQGTSSLICGLQSRLPGQNLKKIIDEFGIPSKLIRLCRMTMTTVTSQIRSRKHFPIQ